MQQFSLYDKVIIFSLLGVAALFISAFFIIRYIFLNVSFAP